MAEKQAQKANDLYLEFDGLVIDTDFREFDPGYGSVNTDSTAGADGLQSSLRIRDTVNPTLTILLTDDASGQAIKAKLIQGAKGQFIWGHEGNDTGKPKWGIDAQIDIAGRPHSHDAEQTLDIEFINLGRDWLFDGRTDTF